MGERRGSVCHCSVCSLCGCRVWENHLKAVDCGEEAGQWLSTFLQEPGLRLLWSAPSMPRVDLTQRHKPWGNAALPGDQVSLTAMIHFRFVVVLLLFACLYCVLLPVYYIICNVSTHRWIYAPLFIKESRRFEKQPLILFVLTAA